MEFMDPIFLLSLLPMASYKDSLSKEALSPHNANGLPHLHRALLRADKNWDKLWGITGKFWLTYQKMVVKWMCIYVYYMFMSCHRI